MGKGGKKAARKVNQFCRGLGNLLLLVQEYVKPPSRDHEHKINERVGGLDRLQRKLMVSKAV